MREQPRSPVVIIGAARSGTNLLRDLLTSWNGLETWPCDEIPFVWRAGNARFPHDEFTPAMARPTVRDTIRCAFRRLERRKRARVVVEKTCANSLRVGFVDAVLPEARFVYVVRDGVDAVASAMKRWVAPLDLPYLARKARFVPWRELPYYTLRFATNRLRRLRSRERRLAVWGPRFEGMEELARTEGLALLAARQWARCVDSADRDLARLDAARVHSIRYEELIADPLPLLRGLASFLHMEPTTEQLETGASRVSPTSVGKGRRELAATDLETIAPVVAAPLARHGYPGFGDA